MSNTVNEKLMQLLIEYFEYVQGTTSDSEYDQNGWLADLDAEAYVTLYGLGYRKK